MARIFVSYKRLNKDQVFPLVEKIEQQVGEKCWVDLEGIESSVQFASVICRAIDNADVVLFMHSSMHLSIDFEKDWTVKELTYAQAKGKRVQLLKLDSSPLDNIFLMEYGSKNNIDANDPIQFNKLIHDLRSWLGKPAVIPAAHAALNLVNLKVLSNMDCKVLIDCEDKGVAVADRLIKISLAPGEYYAEFISTKNPDAVVSKEITLTQDKIEKVDLLSVLQENVNDEEDLTPYISKGKMGYANKHTREIVIPCKYDHANSFSDGLARVKLNGKWGFIDKYGNEVIPCRYERAYSFSEGLSGIKINGEYAYIDKLGKVIISCKYDEVKSFSEGLASFKVNGKWGYIDKTGREVIPAKYESAFLLKEGLACVKFNDKYGYIDKVGSIVMPFEYGYATSFSDGLACVSRDYDGGIKGTFGYIDKSGKLVIPYKYGYAKPFSEGLANVRYELFGNCGFIDKHGKEVLPFIYKDADIFNEGLTYVRSGADSRLYGYMDKAGKIMIPCKYDSAYPFSKGLAFVELNGKSGYIDIFGNEMFPENR